MGIVLTWGFSFGFVALKLCSVFILNENLYHVLSNILPVRIKPYQPYFSVLVIFSHYFKWLPRGAYLFQAHWKRGLIEMGLFNLETTMVWVLHKEREYKVEKLKHKTI